MNIENIQLYQLNDEKEDRLWKTAIFIFDSSALLDFYYLPKKTRQKIYTETFTHLSNRLWVPAHVEFEFLKNRENIISKPISERYDPLKTQVGNIKPMFSKEVQKRIEDIARETVKDDKKSMQALVMTAVGGPEVLQLQSVPCPTIQHPNEILVRVMAAGVNSADHRVRKRLPPSTDWMLPPEGVIVGLGKTLKKIFKERVEKAQNFFDNNIEFYRYYRTNNSFLDYVQIKTNKVKAVKCFPISGYLPT
ncbi:hypothetical protein AM493_04105 [Flavobacterium akiainvivens]|uniref:PIN like domain-containing protein n=1 Tax=Flavobacterium akiainvivens TaxID=1202724 RepID=A0A0M8MBL5_9FLAO|nr:PIN-like domain-containing protein [Flavobacterium akiainvivens]KOS05304.1 hypothetical protein AM493_04105 [Flavobacterium akiainvivens]SFQ76299.1 RteC protein [Flavobacterium akiainvivens]